MSKFLNYNFPNGTGRDTWRTGRGSEQSKNTTDHGFMHRKSLKDNSKGPFTGYQGYITRDEIDNSSIHPRVKIEASAVPIRSTSPKLPPLDAPPSPSSTISSLRRFTTSPERPWPLAINSADPQYLQTEVHQRTWSIPTKEGRVSSPISPIKYSRAPLRPIRRPASGDGDFTSPEKYRRQVMAPYINQYNSAPSTPASIH